jgi:hypothetical protein
MRKPRSSRVVLAADERERLRAERDAAACTQTPASELERLAKSVDRRTRRAVASNVSTPASTLLLLAREFPHEFFSNPAFDLMLLEDPAKVEELPVSALKAILQREDCPRDWLRWVAERGAGALQMALLARPDLSIDLLRLVAEGPNVRAAETAGAHLMRRRALLA